MFNLWNVLDDVMRTDPWFRSSPMGPESGTASSWPLVDVAEADTAYVIHADLPGVKLEDVHIEIEGGVLTLFAQRQPEARDDRQGVHRVERRYGTFTRSFALPQAVEADGVRATMKDGVLTIQLPKTARARPRRIPVQFVAPAESAEPAQMTGGAAEPQITAGPTEPGAVTT